MFKSIEDVRKYIEDTIKAYSKEFCASRYSIRYSNRQRRALATTVTSYMMGQPYKLEFIFNNKYIASYEDYEEDIKDTVLHEIAHAIVGGIHHHDCVWKACCNKIGAEPTRSKAIRLKYN